MTAGAADAPATLSGATVSNSGAANANGVQVRVTSGTGNASAVFQGDTTSITMQGTSQAGVAISNNLAGSSSVYPRNQFEAKVGVNADLGKRWAGSTNVAGVWGSRATTSMRYEGRQIHMVNDRQLPQIVPAQTALVIMHYQTDILALFPSVAATLLANTRLVCDAARARNISVYFAKIHFSAGYPEVSPLNRNGQGIKQLGLFVDDKIAPELGQLPTEPLIIAHRASVFFGTHLEAQLGARGINTLFMAGVASTGVVLSSVAYASDADFRLFTIKDCCYDPDQVVHDHLFSTAFDSRTTVLSLAEASLLLAGGERRESGCARVD